MVMPVMGGAEAYPLLRDARPGARVIVCTGLEQEIVTSGILDDDSSSFLLKPFRPSTLAQNVRGVLDQTADAEHRPFAGSQTS
jgi:DNA-binding NarL/FixJ family response regulator